MRELNTSEIKAVAGAGPIIDDILTAGPIIDDIAVSGPIIDD